MSIVAGIQISLVEWGIFVNLFKIPGPFNEYFSLYLVQLVIWAGCAILLVAVQLPDSASDRRNDSASGERHAAGMASPLPIVRLLHTSLGGFPNRP